ncbi:dipeptidase [Spirochaetota bacterium]
MCDSYYMPVEGGAFFGKNSDRNPAEPQALRILQSRKPTASVSVGPRILETADEGHAMAISCPTWMPGAEMGVNDAGVSIGNEAVFSRFKAAPDGVLGMDFVRAALAGASSAQAALDILISLTERYDQGGNGSYKGKLVYNNSYMIAGPDGAFILETAAKRWAWKAVEGPASISNSYSIADDYKRLDAATRKSIAPVNERMACLDEADAGRLGEKASWKTYVEDRFLSRFTAGDARRRALDVLLSASVEAGNRASAMAVLRAHAAIDPEKPSKPRNICNHDGDIMGNPTTSSMVVEYSPSKVILWFTGASYSCSNLFKPVLLSKGTFIPLWTEYDYDEASAGADAYWKTRRESLKHVWRKPHIADERAGALAKAQATIFEVVDSLSSALSEQELSEARRSIGTIVAQWDGGL